MWKWIVGVIAIILVGLSVFWFNIDKNVRYLLLNQPENQNVLQWTTAQRDAGFQAIEKLGILPYRTVKSGQSGPSLEKGPLLNVDKDVVDTFFEEQRLASVVVIQHGKLRYERYGLGFSHQGKWTTFSVAKSFTSTLVGAALKDGYIKSLNDKVTDYITDMKGSAYDDVTIEQLLTMTSGVKWDEDYSDPNSDVSKFNFHVAEDGIDVTASYMRTLERAHAPGTQFLYSTGETNLIGLLVSEATGKTLAEYLSEKVWQHIDAHQDASWLLGPTGHEISGCCIQATTRDFALFGDFILNGAVVNGESIVPDGWFEKAVTAQVKFDDKGSGYGYQWWISANDIYQGKGIFGQAIYIDPNRSLVIAVNANWESASHRESANSRARMFDYFTGLIDKE